MATGLNLEGKDPKSAVVLFCQRYVSRPVAKDDIVYVVQKHPEGHQATIKLNCIEGHEFAGEFAANPKDAEKNAAKQVLDFYADLIATMPASGKHNKNKRKAPGEVESMAMVPITDVGLQVNAAEDPVAKMQRLMPMPMPSEVMRTSKSELNSHCSKILRRVMNKGEVLYETNNVPGGFQATVQMPGLPDEWGTQVWAGEVSAKKADAEQSVASIALDAIQADPRLMALYGQPPKVKNWNPSKGKGKGGHKGGMAGMHMGSDYGVSSLGGMAHMGYQQPQAMGGFGFAGYGMGGFS